MLAEVENDEFAVCAAAEVMRKLWKPLQEKHSLPDISSRIQSMTRIYENNKQGMESVSKGTLKAGCIFRDLSC
jgi:hypothetical protein